MADSWGGAPVLPPAKTASGDPSAAGLKAKFEVGGGIECFLVNLFSFNHFLSSPQHLANPPPPGKGEFLFFLLVLASISSSSSSSLLPYFFPSSSTSCSSSSPPYSSNSLSLSPFISISSFPPCPKLPNFAFLLLTLPLLPEMGKVAWRDEHDQGKKKAHIPGSDPTKPPPPRSITDLP
jgi:hypothetical protein